MYIALKFWKGRLGVVNSMQCKKSKIKEAKRSSTTNTINISSSDSESDLIPPVRCSHCTSGPIVTDPEIASSATFQWMQFLPHFICSSYPSYLGHTSLLGLGQRPEDRATLLLLVQVPNPETSMSFVGNLFKTLLASAWKSALYKKWDVLVRWKFFVLVSYCKATQRYELDRTSMII